VAVAAAARALSPPPPARWKRDASWWAAAGERLCLAPFLATRYSLDFDTMTVTLEWQFEDPHAVASGKGDTDTADAPRNSTSGRRHYAADVAWANATHAARVHAAERGVDDDAAAAADAAADAAAAERRALAGRANGDDDTAASEYYLEEVMMMTM